MHTQKIGINKPLIIAIFTLALGACGGGGGSGSLLDDYNNRGNSSSSIGGGNSSTPDTTTVQQLGFGSGDTFQQGVIGVSNSGNVVSAGGSTTLTVNIVSGTGNLVTEDINIKFNSQCLASNSAALSLLNGSAVTANSISTTTGEASVVYTAKGCTGADEVTATASFQSGTLTAQATITVESDTVQSITFVDATPTLINLKGTGGQETSLVRFRVLGGTDAPMKDECVTFSLSTTVGGIKLAPSSCNSGDTDIVSAKTNTEGYASVTVQSGSVATPVRVNAVTSNNISTQSSTLAIGTGIPDQDSVSLSLTDIAPVGWGYDGVTSNVTMRMADAFNNPVPDGTAVSFTASGGAIQSSCITTNGECSVVWKSQDPKPVFYGFWVEEIIKEGEVKDFALRCPDGVAECRRGRVKILASAVGNESFTDGNSNGLYDGDADIFTSSTNCSPNVPPSYSNEGINSCDDLSEAYLDKNFNGQWDDDEFFVDINDDGLHTPGNKVYDGKLCNSSLSDCTKDLVSVRGDATLVMACETPYFMPDEGRLPGQPTSTIRLAAGESKTITMLLADCNGNGMPAGTTLSINTETSSNITASRSPSTPLPMSQKPGIISVFLKADDDATKRPSGNVVLEITSPTIVGDVVSSISIAVAGPEI